jgi:hypothetical protein
MGIEDSSNLKGTMQGGVVTAINVQPVPDDLLTDTERVARNVAQNAREIMSGGGTKEANVRILATQIGENMTKFVNNMGSEIMNSPNIANAPMELFKEASDDEGLVGKIYNIFEKAGKELGGSVGNIQENETVSKYINRIMKEAVKQGKVEDVFGKL